MKPRVIAFWLAVLLSAGVGFDARADFSAKGRSSKKAPKAAAQKRVVAPTPSVADPKNNPEPRSSAALIARYTALALQQPGSPFPIERLSQLYRERDGNLDQLIADLETRARANGTEAWNAKLALGAVFEQATRYDRALETYSVAATERPNSALPRLALGRLLTERGDKAGARKALETALPLLKEPTDIEQTQRTLRGLCLDLQDFPAAQHYHKALVALAKGSFFVKAELGRELSSRGHDQLAEAEYRGLVQSAQGDHRASSSALRDLGVLLGKQKKYQEALDTLKRALQTAGDSGLRREILMLSADLYRSSGRASELIQLLEKDGARDFERQRLLAELYEESGEIDKALVAYKAALDREPRDINTHLKLIQLLQLQGQLDRAIQEYERLVRVAPDNPDFIFRLAEALIQHGDRAKALSRLTDLENRSRANPDTAQALVDFYERIGEDARALAVLERSSAGGAPDAQIWIELGRRYFKAGDKDRAERTWKRVLQAGQNKASAWQALGDVYSEHDMSEAALDAFGRAMALAPGNPQYRKAYALALERSGSSRSRGLRLRQYDEAQKIWEGLLAEQVGPADQIAREARQHIVTLWSLSGDLTQRLKKLEQRVRSAPTDTAARHLLAEGQIRLRHYAAAEGTLRALHQQLPGDRSVLMSLERVLVMQRKLQGAIDALANLVRIDPQRAREYYQRMSGYATELYQDDRALEYAARVVELGPGDADSHRKLAEIHRRRQSPDKAIDALRMALSKNDRLFPAYIELAELLINRNDTAQADQLLRRVAEISPDDELVARALRLCIQINLGKGTLESLETELLPLSVAQPNRPVYRRMLIETYRALTLPLLTSAKSSLNQAHEPANQLQRIGQRAVGPLLDALADQDEAQQRTAIELLEKLHNMSAAPALLTYAMGQGDAGLRARAMIAVGTLNDPRSAPRLEAFLFQNGQLAADESDPVSMAAVWTLARQRSPQSSRLLRRILIDSSGNLKALCAVGLGLAKDRSALGSLLQLAANEDEAQIVRAAAAHALADMDANLNTSLTNLLLLSDPDVRAIALVALTRLRLPEIEKHIASELLSSNAHLERAARISAVLLNAKRSRPRDQQVNVSSDLVDVRTMLRNLDETAASPDEELLALERLSTPIYQVALSALDGPSDRTLRLLEALMTRNGAPAFGALTSNFETASPEAQARATRVLEALTQSLLPKITALIQHPPRRVQIAALGFLVTREEPEAKRTVLDVLSHGDAELQESALQATLHLRDPDIAAAVAHMIAVDGRWPMRVKAAQALGAMSWLSSDTTNLRAALATLEKAALQDEYALVRQAALQALKDLDRQAAQGTLIRASRQDSEAKVRETAKDLLSREPSKSP